MAKVQLREWLDKLEKKVGQHIAFVLCGRFRFSRATAGSTPLLPRDVFQTEIYVRHFDAL